MDAHPEPTGTCPPSSIPEAIASGPWRAILEPLGRELRGRLDVLRGGCLAVEAEPARPVTVEQRQRLRTMTAICDGLIDLTATYLELAALGRATGPPTAIASTIAAELDALDRQFAARAAAGPITWSCVLSGDDAPIRAAGPGCRAIFGHLIANALRFTPPGGAVAVTAGRAGSDWQLTVADTGPGIPAEALGRVFEPFYRVPGATAEDPGDGLGLAIARELARLYGGRIRLESAPGRGTTAIVRLPLGGPQDRAPAETENQNM